MRRTEGNKNALATMQPTPAQMGNLKHTAWLRQFTLVRA